MSGVWLRWVDSRFLYSAHLYLQGGSARIESKLFWFGRLWVLLSSSRGEGAS